MDINTLFPAEEWKYTLPEDSRVFVEVPGVMRWHKKPMQSSPDDGRRYYFLSVEMVGYSLGSKKVNLLQPGNEGMTHFSYMACEKRLVIRDSQTEAVIVFPCENIQTATLLVQLFLLPHVRELMPAYKPQEVVEMCEL